MAKKSSSIEERVEDWVKSGLKSCGVKYYTKTDSLNTEIDRALKTYPSKDGGNGGNTPDVKLLLNTKTHGHLPVMIEVKGTRGKLIKTDSNGEVENLMKNGKQHCSNIKNYAVNGAVHYANAILKETDSYKEEAIAIGVNGYFEGSSIQYEIGVYYVGQKNFYLPKKVKEYSDFSFLSKLHIDSFLEEIENIGLSAEEIEAKTTELEGVIEKNLKALNQVMQDELDIAVAQRVKLITGLIMAGLGVPNKVWPLKVSDLRGEEGENTNDGNLVLNKIKDFLEKRNLPKEKIQMIANSLQQVFVYSDYQKPYKTGESKIKRVYEIVLKSIIPYFNSRQHIDFTGKLFNVLNDWVKVPDGDKNDVVITPRYITDFMAKLARVNKDSYVWDYALGSAGFLISAMKLMIIDAQTISSPKERDTKIQHIKYEQLLGVEKLSDIYLLAVLNMILMDDGSCNIIQQNSLDFDGKYQQGKRKGKYFPADVFLLNPPYSASGKGFVFVDAALKRMKKGRAVVLIQENAGSGSGLPYTKNILKKNTLLASIHMSDIFFGKANVQTAVYVFEIGTPHDVHQKVKFIDFSNDGYSRQNRRKASQVVNLRDVDHAAERYDEVIKLVLFGRSYLNYFGEEQFIEDTITLNGNDWTYAQHKKIDRLPSNNDYNRVVGDMLEWSVSKANRPVSQCSFSEVDELRNEFLTNGGVFKEVRAEELFKIETISTLDKRYLDFSQEGEYPYFTRTVSNNGVLGNVNYYDEKHKMKGNALAVGLLAMKFFYIEHDFYAGQFTKAVYPRFEGFNSNIAQYFISWFNKSSELYLSSGRVSDFDRLFYDTPISVPFKNEIIALDYIISFVEAMKRAYIRAIKEDYDSRIALFESFLQTNVESN